MGKERGREEKKAQEGCGWEIRNGANLEEMSDPRECFG